MIYAFRFAQIAYIGLVDVPDTGKAVPPLTRLEISAPVHMFQSAQPAQMLKLESRPESQTALFTGAVA